MTKWDAPKVTSSGIRYAFGPAKGSFTIKPRDEDHRDAGDGCHHMIGMNFPGPKKLQGWKNFRVGQAWKNKEFARMVAKCCGSPRGDNRWNGQWERQTDGRKYTCEVTTCPPNKHEDCFKCNLRLKCIYYDWKSGDFKDVKYDVIRNKDGECKNLQNGNRWFAKATAGKIVWYFGRSKQQANVWWKTH